MASKTQPTIAHGIARLNPEQGVNLMWWSWGPPWELPPARSGRWVISKFYNEAVRVGVRRGRSCHVGVRRGQAARRREGGPERRGGEAPERMARIDLGDPNGRTVAQTTEPDRVCKRCSARVEPVEAAPERQEALVTA